MIREINRPDGIARGGNGATNDPLPSLMSCPCFEFKYFKDKVLSTLVMG